MRSAPVQLPSPPVPRAAVFWTLAVVLLAVAFALRMRGAESVVRPDGAVHFRDYDTLRRLERIDAVTRAGKYPVRERKDGFPEGTVSHWTRPFDWFLQGLDPIVAPLVPRAKAHEAAAVYAGPLLGVLAVGLFLWGAVRLLGRTPGVIAAAFYALQYPLLKMSAAGNGDHQNLQHLCLLAFGWLWLLGHAGRIGPFAAPLSGAALGLAIWVSTESMVVFLTYAGVTALLCLVAPRAGQPPRAEPHRAEPPRAEPHRAAAELRRCGALATLLLVALACEQSTFLAVEWDKVSWFQIYPVAVFTLFLGLFRLLPDRRGRAVLAAALGLAPGLLGLWLIPGFGAAVARELAAFADVNVWLQTCVSEFRPSFRDTTGGLSLAVGLDRFSVFFLGLPVFVVATAVAAGHTAGARVVLLTLTVASAALAVWEVKLSHLFAIWLPVTVVAGWMELTRRLLPRGAAPASLAVLAGAFVVAGLLGLPAGPRPDSPIAVTNEGIRELCAWLRRQKGSDDAAVLAPWDFGAAIMYRAGWPVVASGYHRNIDGIRDGYRVYCAQPTDRTEVEAILARRRVRYLVAFYDRRFLQDAQTVLGTGLEFARATGQGIEFTPLAQHSLFWRLRYGGDVPGFRPRYRSRIEISLGGRRQPLFQVFAVQR